MRFTKKQLQEAKVRAMKGQGKFYRMLAITTTVVGTVGGFLAGYFIRGLFFTTP